MRKGEWYAEKAIWQNGDADYACWPWCLGDWWRALGSWLGSTRRPGIYCDDQARARFGHQLDRYRRGLWPGPLGNRRRQGYQGARAALYIHQGFPGVG